jgi:hypothetical protein
VERKIFVSEKEKVTGGGGGAEENGIMRRFTILNPH